MLEFCIDLTTVLIIGSDKIIKYYTHFIKKYTKKSINIVYFYNSEKFLNRQSGFIGEIDLAIIDIFQPDWLEFAIKIKEEDKHKIKNILLTRNGDDKKYQNEITKSDSKCFKSKEIFSNLIEECVNIEEYTTSSLKNYINMKFKRDYYKKLSTEYYNYVDENKELKNKIESFITKEQELYSKIDSNKKSHACNILKLHEDLCESIVLMKVIDNNIKNNNLRIDELMNLFKELSIQIHKLDEKLIFMQELYNSNQDNITILEECFQKVSNELKDKLELKSLVFNLEALKEYTLKISPNIVEEILSHYLKTYLVCIKNNPPKIQNTEFIKIKSTKPFTKGKVYLQMDFFTESIINFKENSFIKNVTNLLNIQISSQFMNNSQKVIIFFPPEMVYNKN